jgi:hypothetical protein
MLLWVHVSLLLLCFQLGVKTPAAKLFGGSAKSAE